MSSWRTSRAKIFAHLQPDGNLHYVDVIVMRIWHCANLAHECLVYCNIIPNPKETSVLVIKLPWS